MSPDKKETMKLYFETKKILFEEAEK